MDRMRHINYDKSDGEAIQMSEQMIEINEEYIKLLKEIRNALDKDLPE